MRLDEWQKFIESQFLEETAARPAPVKSAIVPSADQQTTLLLDDDSPLMPPETEAGEPTSRLLIAAISADIAPEQEHSAGRAGSGPQTVQTTPRQTGFVVRSVAEAPAVEPAPLPAVSPIPPDDVLDLDADIPIFADYLPSKSSAPAPPPAEIPAEAPARLEDSASGPVSVLLPLTSGFVTVNKVPVRPVDADGSAAAAVGHRRTRAPHARNVQPETGASGLASADLWSQVPRHVQTLLALERREEEREVAQSSYKRPFQEKRAELIARILDPVLSLEDTARLLNVCPTTVRRYTNKGILTHYRKEPERPTANATERETRQRRFRLSDILTFLETQQSALQADRLQERVAPSRRKRAAAPLEPASQE